MSLRPFILIPRTAATGGAVAAIAAGGQRVRGCPTLAKAAADGAQLRAEKRRKGETGRKKCGRFQRTAARDDKRGDLRTDAREAPFSRCNDAGGRPPVHQEHLRQKRYELDPDVDKQPSPAIDKLTLDERGIVSSILQRVDPERKVSPRLEARGWYIDPFWDPFKRVEDLQQQVAHDLSEFARLVGAAEARRQRLLLRASLRRHYRLHDPLYRNSRNAFGSTRSQGFPTPHRMHERFWDPTVDIRVALKNNNMPICWRDLHILHHFVGENGLILPRRTTHASRYQQRCIFKAICMARRMALFPYDWKPTPGELMPIMDPLQYLANELTTRYLASGDLRAEAMVRVMLVKYPELNYSRYLRAKALRSKRQRAECQKRQQEGRNDFSGLLRQYKEVTIMPQGSPPWESSASADQVQKENSCRLLRLVETSDILTLMRGAGFV